MPPDISAGPMALAAGTPPGRASGLIAAGPPGSDPLAALFAALLAGSTGQPTVVPTLKTAVKPTTEPVNPAPDKAAQDKPAKDKTGDTTLSAALPPLPTPNQMRPTFPPTAGVPAGQKTTEKTMDTSPAPASPVKEKADVKPGGELPLQDARMAASGASALFPAFLIASPMIASPTPPVVSPARDNVTASPVVQGPSAAASSLPVVKRSLPDTAPVASPTAFVFGPATVTAQPPTGNTAPPTANQVTPADGGTRQSDSLAPSAALPVTAPPPASVKSASVKSASVIYVPQSQGLSVPTDAVPTLPPRPASEMAAADSPMVTPLVPASSAAGRMGQASPNAAPGLIPTLPQVLLAAAVQASAPRGANLEAPGTAKSPFAAPLLAVASGMTATNELTVTDGKAAMDGGTATDGKVAMEGRTATEGRAATDGKIAMDGRAATEGKTLAAGGAPEKGLKSAALPADTLTRGQAVPAKALPTGLPTGLGLQVIGKRSERRAESVGGDALPALPTPAPAQAEAARTEAKPLTAADRAEMIRQVADGVGAMPPPAKPGASEQMTLQLHPRDWGQLQISVRITPGADPNATQAVTAHIVAETRQVKAALENGSGDLRQALRAAGLHLDRISVTVQSMDASAQAGTATSGGRHEANHGGASQGMGGAFGETTPNQKTGMSNGTGMSGASGNGMPSFAASGGSHGGRQGGQPPPAYAAAYAPTEPEDVPLMEAPRRLATSQVDIRA